jgi:hypothetical protein
MPKGHASSVPGGGGDALPTEEWHEDASFQNGIGGCIFSHAVRPDAESDEEAPVGQSKRVKI